MIRIIAILVMAVMVSGCASLHRPGSGDGDLEQSFKAASRILSGQETVSDAQFEQALHQYRHDDDFHCRQPVYWRLFHSAGLPGKSAEACHEAIPLGVEIPSAGRQKMSFDPERIHAVHLLYAGKSPALASRFGHVALRLVICPTATSTAAECDANLFEHIVLGFSAHVDELSIDTLEAINGGYRAYLFAHPFMDIYRNYAIHEFRELYSVPFQLNQEQRQTLVRELAEIHWRHSGEYRFFSRNCATLLQDALQLAMPSYDDAIGEKRFLRPDRWFNALMQSDLLDHQQLDSLILAEQGGYYFSSTKPFYEQAFMLVRDQLSLPLASIDDYLKINPRLVRSWLEQDSLMAQIEQDANLKEASLMLEEYRAFASERWMMIEGAKFLQNIGLTDLTSLDMLQLGEQETDILERCFMHDIKRAVLPRDTWPGIPGAADMPARPSHQAFCSDMTNRKALADAVQRMAARDPVQWDRLQLLSQTWLASLENIVFLNQISLRQ